MGETPTEREFLEGLRYEDKFPDPLSSTDGAGRLTRGEARAAHNAMKKLQAMCKCGYSLTRSPRCAPERCRIKPETARAD